MAAGRNVSANLQLSFASWAKGWQEAAQEGKEALQKVQNAAVAAGNETAAAGKKAQGGFGGMKSLADSVGGAFKNMATMAGGIIMSNFLMQLPGKIAGVISETDELGESVRRYMLVTGQSAEVASDQIFAFKEMGIDADAASIMIGRFTKNMFALQVANEDGSAPNKTTSQLLEDLGVKATTATGDMRPLNDLLMDIADRFHAMPDGALKTASAIAMFGRSGINMLPFLNQGSAGLKELYATATKLGLTLSGDNVNKIHEYTVAQRTMGEAVGGLKMQIGLMLMPQLTKLADWFVAHQPQIREFIVNLMQKGKEAIAALKAAYVEIQPTLASFLTSFEKGWKTIQPAFQWLLEHKIAMVAAFAAIGVAMLLAFTPISLPVLAVMAAIAGLLFVIGRFRDQIKVILHDIVAIWNDDFGWLQTIATGIFENIYNQVKFYIDLVRGIINIVMALIHGDWKGAWDALKKMVVNCVNDIKNSILGIFTELKGMVEGIWMALGSILEGQLNKIIDMVNGLLGGINKVGGWLSKIPGVDIPTVGQLPHVSFGGTFSTAGVTGFGGGGGGGKGEMLGPPVPFDADAFAKWIAASTAGPTEGGGGLDTGGGAAAGPVETLGKAAATSAGQVASLGAAAQKTVDPIQQAMRGFQWAWRVSGMGWGDFIHKTLVEGVPKLASGIKTFAGGLAMIGEKGPELAVMPQNSQVWSAADTSKILAGGQRDSKLALSNEFNFNLSGDWDGIKRQVVAQVLRKLDEASVSAGIRTPLTLGGVGAPRL
jgi:hypothetical protein